MSGFSTGNEFSGTAVDNRMKRRQNFTPFMKWEFRRDLFRMLRNIRHMKPSIDQGPPKQPSIQTLNRSRQIVEEGRLRLIERENQQLLERLRKIHNRPRSHFCHLKKRGDPLIKGDAFRLKKPSGAPGYLVQLYKDLKLANPVTNRKSIRVQQEMLTSAMELVQASNRNKPSEELLDSVVQLTLDTVEEAPSSPDATTSEGGTASDGGATVNLEGQPMDGEAGAKAEEESTGN
ncbi:hypothetical protein AXG93_154s1850 [Marchantia polymorpha subsp. ruderalis]|uniref:Uncharacterized protein n=1 Tax=Marchantia polymorpha subsp. ruderalis TaxID=1480154 RepID=A0A176VK69_MARPO|nr:hypothetical protein AXG93_154s1850 [Marchantia polymorpha subsp. ruderalis]